MSRRRDGMKKRRNQQEDSPGQSNAYQDPHYYPLSDNTDQFLSQQNEEETFDGTSPGSTRDRYGMSGTQRPFPSGPAWSQSDLSSTSWRNQGIDTHGFDGFEHTAGPHTQSFVSTRPSSSLERIPQYPYNMEQGRSYSDGSVNTYDVTRHPGWNNLGYPPGGYPQNLPTVPTRASSQGTRTPAVRELAVNPHNPAIGEVPAATLSPLNGRMQTLSLDEPRPDSAQTYLCPNDCGALLRGAYASGNMTRHLKTCPSSNEEKTKVRCTHPGCGKYYARTDGLAVHKRKHHGG